MSIEGNRVQWTLLGPIRGFNGRDNLVIALRSPKVIGGLLGICSEGYKSFDMFILLLGVSRNLKFYLSSWQRLVEK